MSSLWYKVVMSPEDYQNGLGYQKITRELNSYYEGHRGELKGLKIFEGNDHEENYIFYLPPFDLPFVHFLISDLNGVITAEPENDKIHVFWEPY